MSLTTLPLDISWQSSEKSISEISFGLGRSVAITPLVIWTCKDLHWHTQGYHVWLPRSQECLRRIPSLRRSIPALTFLTTEELKAFTVCQAKLRLRWDRKSGLEKVFTAAGLTEEPGFDNSWILPGGEDVLPMSGSGEIKLCRITLSNAGASLKHLTRTSLNLCMETVILRGGATSITCRLGLSPEVLPFARN